MPYQKYTRNGVYYLKNIRTGQVRRYKSDSDRANAIRLSEAFSHGWRKPTYVKKGSMCHRHGNDLVPYHTRKGKLMKRKRPIHSQFIYAKPIIVKKKAIEFRDSDKPLYTLREDNQDVYIGNFPEADVWEGEDIAEALAHEDTHNLLGEEVSEEAKVNLDNIVVPHIVDDETGELLNPRSASEIVGSRDEARSEAILELERQLSRTNDEDRKNMLQEKIFKLGGW